MVLMALQSPEEGNYPTTETKPAEKYRDVKFLDTYIELRNKSM